MRRKKEGDNEPIWKEERKKKLINFKLMSTKRPKWQFGIGKKEGKRKLTKSFLKPKLEERRSSDRKGKGKAKKKHETNSNWTG